MSTIFDSYNVDAQDQIFPTHEFHSLLQKMNIEQCIIFNDVMFKKKQNPNEPLHMFFIEGVGIGKTFMLMLLIQGLLCFYYKHPQSNLSKNIIHDMH
jgi:hypothetical protein